MQFTLFDLNGKQTNGSLHIHVCGSITAYVTNDVRSCSLMCKCDFREEIHSSINTLFFVWRTDWSAPRSCINIYCRRKWRSARSPNQNSNLELYKAWIHMYILINTDMPICTCNFSVIEYNLYCHCTCTTKLDTKCSKITR